MPERDSHSGEERILDGFRRLGGCRDVSSAIEVAADLAWERSAPSWLVVTAMREDGTPLEVVRGVPPADSVLDAVRTVDPVPPGGLVIPGDATLDAAAGHPEGRTVGPALAFPLALPGCCRAALVVGFGTEGALGAADRDYFSFLGRQLTISTERLGGAESFLRDASTGLRTHVGFLLRLLDEWSICETKGSPISIVLIDIGLPSGEEGGFETRVEAAMRRAAAVLREETGEFDLLARRGPRTLEILLPQVGASWANRIASRIARRIGEETIPAADGGEVPMACAVGVATAPEDAGSAERLLQAVEERVEAGREGLDLGPDGAAVPGDQGMALLAMLSRVLEAGWDLDSLLDIVVGMLVELLRAERGFVLVRDSEGSLTVRSARARGNHEIDAPEKEVSRGITKRVLETGQPILIHDAATHPLFADSESVVGLGIRAVLCVPIRSRGDAFGCVYLEHRSDPGRFTSNDQDLLEEFARRVSTHLRHSMEFRRKSRDLERASRRLEGYLDADAGEAEEFGIVGRSPGLRRALDLLRKAIPCDLPVHVTGESGTGKELIARAIHFEGPRATGPFVSENCAAIPESIFERELFGHVRGVFTGASTEKPGLIEAANGGTLFLDEIGELSPGMQAKILRAIEEKGIRRLGGQEWIQVDFRLVTASNRSLEELVRDGRFREDLYYRLEGMTVSLPPLRERKDDIPLLVEHFLRREAEKQGRPARRVRRDVLLALLRHEWPGNVRELENTLRRACAVGGEEITLEDLPRRLKEETAYKRYLAAVRQARPGAGDVEEDGLLRAIERAGGNKTEAARRLGISKSTLYARLQRLRERTRDRRGGP